MQLVNKRPTRQRYHETLTDNTSDEWKNLLSQSEETNLPMEVLLRKKTGDPEPGMPVSALYDMMAREDIYPGSSWSRPAQTVKEATSTPLKLNLQLAHWDKLFHDRIWGKPSDLHSFAQTVDQLVPGSIYRPYSDGREVINRNRRTPEIRLEQIVGEVITQSDDLIRASGFTVDGGLQTLVEVPENETFPEVMFTVDQDASGMKKVGFSLSSSREAKFREQYVQTVDRVVEQIADLQATALTNEGVKLIMDEAPSRNGVLANTIEGLTNLATSSENGYAVDTILMHVDKFRTLVPILQRLGGSDQPLPVGAEARVPGIFGSIEILNNTQRATRYGYFTGPNAAVVGLGTNDAVAFPVATTLDMYQQTQGMVDEEAYYVPNQKWTRVISMIYGYKCYDVNGIDRRTA